MTPEQLEQLWNWMMSVSESLCEHRKELDRLEERILSLELQLHKKEKP